MEEEVHQQQPCRSSWEALPSSAIVNIFCKLPIKDRFQNLPFVCKSWFDASFHSRCWASMIPDSSSAAIDYAFVKDSSYPYFLSFPDPFDVRRNSDPGAGVNKLRALIGRAAGGGGDGIVSMYFFPFLTAIDGPPNDDDLLRLIAQSCPNLRHLSFHGSYNASEGAVLEVICRCPKLELIDFSDTPYFTPKVLEEMSACCLNLRGIRRNGILEPSTVSVLTAVFPNLTILNLSNSTIVDKDLLNIVTKRTGLQYLDVTNCQQLRFYMYIIKGALSQIAEIIYD